MKILMILIIFLFTACSGGPEIRIEGECLSDSQCEEGYYCNDKARCEKISVDGDLEEETEPEGDTESISE